MEETRDSVIRRFRFDGKGVEYFKIWIVNILLSILTLGIYSAWAKVRTSRYFYGNTFLDDSGFEYHAKPLQILKGRLIAVAALLAYIALDYLFPIAGAALAIAGLLVLPWVIWSSLRFTAKMSSYRNVRFGFRGKLSDAYLYLLVVPFLPALIVIPMIAFGDIKNPLFGIGVGVAVLAFYLMVPYVQALFQDYYVNGSRYGQGVFRGKIRPAFYYLTYLKFVGLGLLGMLLLTVVFAGFVYANIDPSFLQTGTEGMNPQLLLLMMGPSLLAVFILYVILAVWLKSYLQAAFRNYLFSQSRLDRVVSFNPRVTATGLFKVQFVNLLMLIFTLGLAYPWTRVRLARYSADTLDAHFAGDPGLYVQRQENAQSALAEELGEAFDVDADLGLTL